MIDNLSSLIIKDIDIHSILLIYFNVAETSKNPQNKC